MQVLIEEKILQEKVATMKKKGLQKLGWNTKRGKSSF